MKICSVYQSPIHWQISLCAGNRLKKLVVLWGGSAPSWCSVVTRGNDGATQGRESIYSKQMTVLRNLSCHLSAEMNEPAAPPDATVGWCSPGSTQAAPGAGSSRTLLAPILHVGRLPLRSELRFGYSVSRPCVHACVFLVYENKPFCFIISFPRTVSIFMYLCLYK